MPIDKYANEIGSYLSLGLDLKFQPMPKNDIPFVCPKCGTRGTTNGKYSTVIENESKD